jgi:hypothetical protein
MEAQGRHREMGSEGSVEQSRGPMDKKRIMRPTRPDERASARKVHSHQRPGVVGGRAVKAVGFTSGDLRLPLGFGTEIDASRSDRGAEVSGGIVGGAGSAEGLNGGVANRTAISRKPCGRRISGN